LRVDYSVSKLNNPTIRRFNLIISPKTFKALNEKVILRVDYSVSKLNNPTIRRFNLIISPKT